MGHGRGEVWADCSLLSLYLEIHSPTRSQGINSQCNHMGFSELHCLDMEKLFLVILSLFNLHLFPSNFALRSLHICDCNKNWFLTSFLTFFKPPPLWNLHRYQQGLVFDLHYPCKGVRILPAAGYKPPAPGLMNKHPMSRGKSQLCHLACCYRWTDTDELQIPSPCWREEIVTHTVILLLPRGTPYPELSIKVQPNPHSCLWRISYKIQ